MVGCAMTAINLVAPEDEMLANEIESIVSSGKAYAWDDQGRLLQDQAKAKQEAQADRMEATINRARLKDLFSRNRSFRTRVRRFGNGSGKRTPAGRG